ncbi:MAG: AMP-binding protein [Deltaproteobacteria bacterium]|nr:AMP-binding protein [Deltaproteobacteria bacterium]
MTNDFETFARVLEQQAVAKGDETFLLFEGECIGYAELDRRANRIAAALARRGVGQGSGVAIMMNNSPAWLEVFFGTQKLGAYAVPINVALRGEGLGYIIDHSEAATLVVDADLLDAVLPIRAERSGLSRLIVNTSYLVDPATAPPVPADAVTLADLAAEGSPEPRDRDLTPGGKAVLLYTSGTTGLPKAVVVQRGGFSWAGVTALAQAAYGPGEVLYTCLPLFHANALFLSVMQALRCALPIAIGRRFSASRFWDDLRRYDASTFNALGAMIPILLKQPPRPSDRQHRVHVVFSAAAPKWAWEQFEERFGTKIWEAYGAVDGGGFMLFNMGNGPKGSMGVPPPGVDARVFREDGTEAEPGEVGELVFKVDDPVARRVDYFKNEKASAAKIRDGWFHTGDLASRDDEGWFYFADRATDSLRRRGENISSFEIEKIVNQHPSVLESGAYGVPSELGEDDVMLAVVKKPGMEVTPQELVAFCEQRMAKFMVPRYIDFRDSLPKTETHRVQKANLKKEGVTATTWDREKTAPPRPA